ncbi:MAG TPA: hypothetical protein VJ732_20000, partial [Bryobacteraceae bacterium]|nr:hypothetical protein [Bryobacteraceae bacterium]
PKVIEQTVRALTALRALPQDPEACLRIAARCWEPSTAKPLFDCWRAKAPRAGLLAQATSASWTVRALALEASAETAAFDSATRDRLLRSAAELLSHDLSGVPAPNAVSYSTAQLARNALSQISGRNMAVALEYADRIVPLSGHHTFAGRFGESYDLAAKDPSAYADLRRGPQLLEAGLAALLAAALLAIPRTRRLAVALWAAAGVWCMFTLFETEAAQLPPPPLGYLTATCLALFSGGLTAGCLAATRVPDGRKWQVRRCSPASSRLWYAAGRAWPVVSDRFGRLGAALRSSGMRPARGPVCFCAVVDPGPLEDSDARRRYCPSNWMRSPDSERKRGTSSGLTSSFLR